jgi:hypothetical protein
MKKPRKPKPRDKPKSGQQASRPPAPPKPPEPPPEPLGAAGFPKRKPSFVRILEVAGAVAGLVAFSYLLFDLFYQAASPDIEVSSSETGAPFNLPFSVKTQSIVFTMHRASFTCGFDMTDTSHNTWQIGSEVFAGTLEINRRNPGNYFCRNQFPANIIVTLTVRVVPKYCTNILWLYCWEREPEAAVFTWVRKDNSGNGYWIKGKLGN